MLISFRYGDYVRKITVPVCVHCSSKLQCVAVAWIRRNEIFMQLIISRRRHRYFLARLLGYSSHVLCVTRVAAHGNGLSGNNSPLVVCSLPIEFAHLTRMRAGTSGLRQRDTEHPLLHGRNKSSHAFSGWSDLSLITANVHNKVTVNIFQ